jgi:hypothetical protein
MRAEDTLEGGGAGGTGGSGGCEGSGGEGGAGGCGGGLRKQKTMNGVIGTNILTKVVELQLTEKLER